MDTVLSSGAAASGGTALLLGYGSGLSYAALVAILRRRPTRSHTRRWRSQTTRLASTPAAVGDTAGERPCQGLPTRRNTVRREATAVENQPGGRASETH